MHKQSRQLACSGGDSGGNGPVSSDAADKLLACTGGDPCGNGPVSSDGEDKLLACTGGESGGNGPLSSDGEDKLGSVDELVQQGEPKHRKLTHAAATDSGPTPPDDASDRTILAALRYGTTAFRNGPPAPPCDDLMPMVTELIEPHVKHNIGYMDAALQSAFGDYDDSDDGDGGCGAPGQLAVPKPQHHTEVRYGSAIRTPCVWYETRSR